ncbi:hypothetical protein ACJZ2D_000294 [Fusarium nematophilum]
MKFSVLLIGTLASIVTAQSCAGGAGFCDGSGHCQDGSGVVSPDVDPDCVGGGATGGGQGGNDANDGNGGNGGNNANGGGSSGGNVNQGGPCAGGAGFCDGGGFCQDGSGVVSPDVDPECFV